MRERKRVDKMKISYSFGVLDLFHYGHLRALTEAAKGADLHVVGIVSDKSAKDWLGNIASNEDERRAVIRSISCVDWVMPQKTMDPTENIRKLHYIYPEAEITLFRGDNTSIMAAQAYLKSIGGEVQTLDYYSKLSPMKILNVLNSQVDGQNKRLGIISTKANTLLAIRERITKATIEEIYVITVAEIKNDIEAVYNDIRNLYNGRQIVVRSSSTGEDSFSSSNAGHFESVIGVASDDKNAVIAAINEVYNSYSKDGEVAEDEQILIQSLTEDVRYSGVVFTRDIQKNRPYYVINYDDRGVTDAVTGGLAAKTIWIAQDCKNESIPKEWQGLWAAIKELELVVRDILLDIEFAIKNDGAVVIFQVRPLAASYRFGRNVVVSNILEKKNDCKEMYVQISKKQGVSFLSDMAFWNPAEIIGDITDPLSYSLYKAIITHRAWNEGLVPMGYRKVEGELMHRIGVKPYISLKHSFFALIPAALPRQLAEKIAGYYESKLKKDLSAHDKIEFEIVFSCFDFSLKDKLKNLDEFSTYETETLYTALKKQTSDCIMNYTSVLEADNESLGRLEEVRKRIECDYNDRATVQDIAKCIEELIDAIISYGTPQFSRQARYAFISKSLSKSLLEQGYWNQDTYDNFQKSVHTIAETFENDLKRLQNKLMDRAVFDERYGHLRAGTYDIASPRYDTIDFEELFKPQWNNATVDFADKTVVFAKGAGIEGLKKAIQDAELNWDVDNIVDFMRKSMEERERFKFIFTKSLSRVLELIARMGAKLGYDRQVMSGLEIQEIVGFAKYSDEMDVSKLIKELVPYRTKLKDIYSKVIMPNVITSEKNFDFVLPIDSRPNFITAKNTNARTVMLSNDVKVDVKDKIVVIEKADPGYDWVFSKGIAGLITKYGGTASHMAIRCAEFDIPAAIGCGEKAFSYVIDGLGNRLYLDCAKGILQYN